MTTPLTDEEIQQLRELCDKATPGPWEYFDKHTIHTPPIHADEADYGIPDEGFEGGYRFVCWDDPGAWRYADGHFIAAARTALPRLLEEVDRLKELDRMRGGDQGWVDRCVHYRNLAIMLGAKPHQMTSKYDAALAERGLEEDKEWGDPINGIVETWEELEAAEAENTRLKKATEQTIEVLVEFHAHADPWQWWKSRAKPLLDNLKTLRDGKAEQ